MRFSFRYCAPATPSTLLLLPPTTSILPFTYPTRWLPATRIAQMYALQHAKKIKFYDLESSGLNVASDGIFQGATIDTNPATLEILPGTESEWQVALRRDIVPHPEAIFVNHVQPKTWFNGMSEYEFAKKMHETFNSPGTHTIGYNSLKFDDTMVRFLFYRNFLAPYTHQYAKGCGRADVYPMTLLFWIFSAANAMKWPLRNGKPSFKLADLKEANQLVEGQSHTALVDVQATIALAQKFRQANPEFWTRSIAHFNPAYDKKLITECPTSVTINQERFPLGILIKRGFKIDDHFMTRAIFIGPHSVYKNQYLFVNLRTGAVTKKKLGDQTIFLPGDFTDFNTLISDESQLNMQRTLAEFNEHPETLQQLIAKARVDVYPPVEKVDAYGALYETGFPSKMEEEIMQRFHTANPNEKMQIANEFKTTKPVYYELAVRIIGHHFPQYLDREAETIFNNYLKSLQQRSTAPVDYKGELFYTLEEAAKDATKLARTLKGTEHQRLFGDYMAWHKKTTDTLAQLPETEAKKNIGQLPHL